MSSNSLILTCRTEKKIKKKRKKINLYYYHYHIVLEIFHHFKNSLVPICPQSLLPPQDNWWSVLYLYRVALFEFCTNEMMVVIWSHQVWVDCHPVKQPVIWCSWGLSSQAVTGVRAQQRVRHEQLGQWAPSAITGPHPRGTWKQSLHGRQVGARILRPEPYRLVFKIGRDAVSRTKVLGQRCQGTQIQPHRAEGKGLVTPFIGPECVLATESCR